MSWTQFIEGPANPKTKTWNVLPDPLSHSLGIVKWYGPWRRYCFFPNSDRIVILEWECLRDIASFCERETERHRPSNV